MNSATINRSSARRQALGVTAKAAGATDEKKENPRTESQGPGGGRGGPGSRSVALDVMVGTIGLIICLSVIFRQEITFLMASGW